MGLRGCVDAWGSPVKKPELGGRTELKPSLTAPAQLIKRASNKSAAPIKSARPAAPVPASSTAPRGRGRPKLADADKPWVAAGISRRTWYNRQAAKAKDKA